MKVSLIASGQISIKFLDVVIGDCLVVPFMGENLNDMHRFDFDLKLKEGAIYGYIGPPKPKLKPKPVKTKSPLAKPRKSR